MSDTSFFKIITNDNPPIYINLSKENLQLLASRSLIFQEYIEKLTPEGLQGQSISLNISKYLFDKYWNLINGINPSININDILQLFIFSNLIGDKFTINHVIPFLLKLYENFDPFLDKYVIPEILKTLNVDQLTLLMEVYPYLLIVSDYLNTRSDMPNELKMSPIETPIIKEIRENKEKYYTIPFYKQNFYGLDNLKPIGEFAKYVGYGNVDVINYLKDSFNLNPLKYNSESSKIFESRFENAASKGYLEALKIGSYTIIGDTHGYEFPIFYTKMFISAAKSGQLDVLKWLKVYFNITDSGIKSAKNDAFISAATNGHLDVLKWLASNFNITDPYINESSRKAIENGHVEVVRWLQETYQ